MRKQEKNDELIAIHNLTERKLQQIMELGGFAMPSIAITKAKIGHENFGEISILFHESTIDPCRNKQNQIYTCDAYSSRVPDILYQFDVEKINSLFDLKGKDHIRAGMFDHDDGCRIDDVVRFLHKKTDKEESEITRILESECVFMKGIWNGKPPLTNTGNRRSFRCLTVPYTIENMVRYMKKSQGAEAFPSYSVSLYKALMAKKIRSLKALNSVSIQDTESLKERYKNLTAELNAILEDATGTQEDFYRKLIRVKPNDDIDAVRQKLSGYPVSDDSVARIIRFARDVYELPVSYLEAKPARAVPMSEIAAVILPEYLTPEVKADVTRYCERHKIPYREYQEGTRQEALLQMLEEHEELKLTIS